MPLTFLGCGGCQAGGGSLDPGLASGSGLGDTMWMVPECCAPPHMCTHTHTQKHMHMLCPHMCTHMHTQKHMHTHARGTLDPWLPQGVQQATPYPLWPSARLP